MARLYARIQLCVIYWDKKQLGPLADLLKRFITDTDDDDGRTLDDDFGVGLQLFVRMLWFSLSEKENSFPTLEVAHCGLG